MLPKKIHYCWFGGSELPSSVKHCIDSWRQMCPDYEIIRCDESNFDVYSHPFMKAAYESKSWAFVSDYARLKVVYENGGIYLDTDVELIKKLDGLLQEKCYFGLQQMENLCATGLGFGAEKGSRIVKEMMDCYNDIEFNADDKLSISCPILNTKVLINNGYKQTSITEVFRNEEFTVYPSCYFDPFSTITKTDILCDETYSIHHYSASWCSFTQRMKRKLVCFVGEKRFIKIRKWFGSIM